MSAQLHEIAVGLAHAPERALPLARPNPGRSLQRLATLGRAGLVWLPAFAFTLGHASSLPRALGAATLLAAVWTAAMGATLPATRLVVPALGAAGRAAAGTLAGLAAASTLAIWAPWAELHASTLGEIAVACFLLCTGWESLLARNPASRKRVLVVGAADGGAELVDELALHGNPQFEVIGFVDDDRELNPIAGVPCFGGFDALPSVIEAERPDLVVLALAKNRPGAFASLLDAAGSGFEFLGLPEFHEQAFGRVPLRHLTPAWFMSVLHFYRRPYTQVAKRTFDVVVASIGLVLAAPLLPFIWALVRQTPGPAVFRQTRLGEGGRHFTMLKFRTMRQDAETPGLPLWAEERDPRITPAGRFLRKTRLDELPQLWNVLRGDMSIVGPRPERPEFLEFLQQAVPFWTRRHLVKPGITGWAQVRRGYTADMEGTAEKLSYDLWYLRHRSLLIDLAICAKTVATLVSGSGSR